MSKKQMVAVLREGEGVDDFFMVDECDLGKARNGSSYLQMVLSDKTGRIQARKWDAKEEEFEGLNPGDIVRVRGFVESYKSQRQMIVRQWSAAPAGETDILDYLPSSSCDPAQMMAQLESLLEGISNPFLSDLIGAFLSDDTFRALFMRAPAATKMHHAYLGGLLEHTLAMVKVADSICGLYPALDRDLLFAGAFLHDIGKVEELSSDRMIEYTDKGRLVGHISIGAARVAQKAGAIPDFPPDLMDVLVHMVLAHHGRYEFGSPRLPMTAEAFALNMIDDLDAKINAIASMKSDGKSNWSDYVKIFERAFYLGDSSAGG